MSEWPPLLAAVTLQTTGGAGGAIRKFSWCQREVPRKDRRLTQAAKMKIFPPVALDFLPQEITCVYSEFLHRHMNHARRFRGRDRRQNQCITVGISMPPTAATSASAYASDTQHQFGDPVCRNILHKPSKASRKSFKPINNRLNLRITIKLTGSGVFIASTCPCAVLVSTASLGEHYETDGN